MHDDTGIEPRGELGWIETITRLVGRASEGVVGIGDDAAVISPPRGPQMLFASDLLVEKVHFDLATSSPTDVGWKAMAVNVSDMAAMGGRPLHCVVSIAGAGRIDLALFYEGILAAGREFGCEVVGGDCSSGDVLVISIAVIGEPGRSGPILRSGASIGEHVFVTGPLGSSAAGLRLLQDDIELESDLVRSHRRPVPRLSAGECAADGGATAMMDLSDGLAIDLHRLAQASKVGAAIDSVPIADGATPDEALSGGEDYELLFVAPDPKRVFAAFAEKCLDRPYLIGTVQSANDGVTLQGEVLAPLGYIHGR